MHADKKSRDDLQKRLDKWDVSSECMNGTLSLAGPDVYGIL